MSLIIRKVSKAIVEFLRQVYMKLPQTVAEMENLTQTLLEHHRFPQCIRALNRTHIPNQYINLIKTMLATLAERGLHPSILKSLAITVIAFLM